MKWLFVMWALAGCADEAATQACAPARLDDGRIVIANAQEQPAGLACARDQLYWTNYGDGTIASAPKRGGCMRVLARNQLGPFAIAVDDAHVWWTNLDEGSVRRVSSSGGDAETIATGQENPSALVVS